MSHQPNSEAIEKDVVEERQRVEEAVEAIQRRLTPGQLIDEILNYSQHAGSGFAANLSKTVTANPIPAAMIGFGIIWLMLAQKTEPSPSATVTPHAADPAAKDEASR